MNMRSSCTAAIPTTQMVALNGPLPASCLHLAPCTARQPCTAMQGAPCTARQWHRRVHMCAESEPARNIVSVPWAITFDLRERETLWLEGSKARLVALIARDQLNISQEEMEDRMDIFLTLVPDLQDRVARLPPSLLVSLLQIPLDVMADRIITLKVLFPVADVSAMLGRAPALLLQPSTALREASRTLREIMKTDNVDTLVAEQPLFLDVACVTEVIAELQFMMPQTDVRALLRADPSWILRAQRGQKWLGQNPDQ